MTSLERVLLWTARMGIRFLTLAGIVGFILLLGIIASFIASIGARL